ncbi:S-layer family protein [Anaerobacterium chartisolvens]|uniref:S-layer family protein n=1 Tax=Anaerobacterium chartisolvens TaxID=1297424 RepID=A0A369AHR1_9FIRM|nr:S-layer homology domain-containing protein [Anaerobacterium chartisolvens]RCX07878.1 S-layer family protein [Anaerobacterium chartisolvens]
MKKVIGFIMTFVLIAGLLPGSCRAAGKKFSDVPDSQWYAVYINELSGHKNQIIGGYPGGRFGPADDVLAAQLITMVLRSKGYTNLKYYQGYVDKALELGLVKKGEFDSYTRVITRAEIARVIARAVKGEKFPENLTDYKALIKDFDSIPEAFREDILKVYYLGIVEGGPGGYNPGGSTSRAAASKMILAMLEPKYRATVTLRIDDEYILHDGYKIHMNKNGNSYYIGVAIDKDFLFEGEELRVSISLYRNDLDKQWEETEKLLASKFGENAAKQIVDYASQKNLENYRTMRISKKFTFGGQDISVGSLEGDDILTVTIYEPK